MIHHFPCILSLALLEFNRMMWISFRAILTTTLVKFLVSYQGLLVSLAMLMMMTDTPPVPLPLIPRRGILDKFPTHLPLLNSHNLL